MSKGRLEPVEDIRIPLIPLFQLRPGWEGPGCPLDYQAIRIPPASFARVRLSKSMLRRAASFARLRRLDVVHEDAHHISGHRTNSTRLSATA
jgi:hypothetical protein